MRGWASSGFRASRKGYENDMKRNVIVLCALAATSIWGQRVTDRRTADIRGGGGDGKCTIEVYVDDVAEVEIRGRNASIRTVSGSPASIRRFQCNQEMPTNPYDFRFKGIDGRGRQDLVRAAENGRAAVVRIEDNKGGSEGYTFDIFWRGGSGGYRNDPSYRSDSGYRGNSRDRNDSYRSGSSSYRGAWNNGWGNGSGWGHNETVTFRGRGDGDLRDRNGNRKELHDVEVRIAESGAVLVRFDGNWGKINFAGSVTRRSGRTIHARVAGSNMNGNMEIEMSSHEHVQRIYMRNMGRDQGELRWSR